MQIKDRLGLNEAEVELFHEPRARVLGAFGVADRLDHAVQELEGDAQPFQDVSAFTLLVQVELGAAGDHLKAVIDKDQERPPQSQRYRSAVQQGKGIDAESRLQWRKLEEAVLFLFGRGAAFQFDDDAHAAPVALIAQIADAVKAA